MFSKPLCRFMRAHGFDTSRFMRSDGVESDTSEMLHMICTYSGRREGLTKDQIEVMKFMKFYPHEEVGMVLRYVREWNREIEENNRFYEKKSWPR